MSIKSSILFSKNSKGLSTVVATILMVAITVFTVAIVWAVINNLVEERTENTASCFNSLGEVTINNRFTCYNSSSNELQFSIDVGDFDVDGILVGVSVNGSGETWTFNSTSRSINNLRLYSGSTSIVAPSKNGGQTYIFDLGSGGYNEVPTSLRVAAVVDGTNCEISDSVTEFSTCIP